MVVENLGFNHIKTLNELDVEISCVDENIDQIKKIKTIYPNIEHYSSLKNHFKTKSMVISYRLLQERILI